MVIELPNNDFIHYCTLGSLLEESYMHGGERIITRCHQSHIFTWERNHANKYVNQYLVGGGTA